MGSWLINSVCGTEFQRGLFISELQIIKDLDEFREEINRLHEEIRAELERREAEYRVIGGSPPARICFEELDFSRFRQEMLTVHKTLQWRGNNHRLSTSEARKARLVAIAGMCELIKDEYIGKFWDLYEKIIGWDKDYTVYEWIWAKGFREAGIEMLGDERREFVQTLVMESGIPKSRAADITSFFVIYWRYLRGRNVLDVIRNLDSDTSFANIPRDDRNRLQSLARTATEFTRAFALAVSRLSTVFEYISASDEIFGGSIDDWVNQIFRATGINPQTILRDGDQLRKLYSRILGFVTPEKLGRIMAAKPPGTEVTIPDGRKIRTDHYEKIQLGQHKVDGALFTCLPAPELNLSSLVSLSVSRVIQHGDAVILRSFSAITPVINGSVRTDLVRKLFKDGQDYGHLFFYTKKVAMEISLSTADGKVDAVLSGKDGFVCYPYLHYYGNPPKERHALHARVNSIRLACAGKKNREFRFFCDQEKDPLHEGITDDKGRAACAERSVIIESPEPGGITFTAADGITDEIFIMEEGETKVTLPLAEVMLFSPYSHRQIKPRSTGAPFLFGSRRFVLFSATEPSDDSLLMENCDIEMTTVLGGYWVSSLVWKNQAQPCRIQATISGGQVVRWAFEKCLHFNLYINRKKDNSPEHVVFMDSQGSRPADFELILNPSPDQTVRSELFWNIIVNDTTPLKIPLEGNVPEETSDKSLHISGTNFEKMLAPLWNRKSLVNASGEISLCALDETLASRRFFLFPNLNVILPHGVRDGGEFPIQVDLGSGSSNRKLLLKNQRGRTKVKIRIEYNDGNWQLHRQKFRGKLEIEALGTSLDIEATPPYKAVRFGNRDNGRVEPARDILRREIGPYDLLVATPTQTPPEITVNNKEQEPGFSRVSEGLWGLPLSGLTGTVKNKNRVTAWSAALGKSFTVIYRVALSKLEPEKYVTDRTVSGTCSFCGPVGSRIDLRLTPVSKVDTAGSSVSSFLEPEGKDVSGWPFSIRLSDSSDLIDVDHYELSAFLVNNPSSDRTGYEYGERWKIFPESAVSQNDFGYLKERISELLESKKPFSAVKYIKLAKEIVPDSEQEWLRETEKAVNSMQSNLSLNRVAVQVAKVLKKEYLFEI